LGSNNFQVFPRCEPDDLNRVVTNVMGIFDTEDSGTVLFRELLTTFALSMNVGIRDKLLWTYRKGHTRNKIHVF
jgi:hypothetical protein